ncbi:MAG TPA: hypothetical protein VFN52_05340 [Acidiferrobacteraceae bacterium]|nr:hypothetical protein [Acidiferrobacteraceae bacterium]
MGHMVRYRCSRCRYEEMDLGVGAGRQEPPRLRLFQCDNCHSVGSTWVSPDRVPRCSLCYHDTIVLLPDDAGAWACPKCGEAGQFEPLEGEWH